MSQLETVEEYASLCQSLLAKNQLLEARCEQYQQAYRQMYDMFQELRRWRFGKKSERFVDDGKHQLLLFPNETVPPFNEDTPEETIVSSHKRSNKKKSAREAVRRIEVIPVDESQKVCSCGSCKNVIRYETKELLNYQPAIFEIIEQRREVVACPKGCDGSIITAPTPPHVLPKTGATESLLSFIITSKHEDRQPLYHLEKMLAERHGIRCPRQTMARWAIDLAQPLQPICNLMRDEIISYDVAACDATTLQVLNEPGRAPETKSYIYCMRGGPPENAVICYEYNDREHKSFTRSLFEGFSGYLHVDASNVFDDMGNNVALVYCNTHARRKFEPIAKAAKKNGLAKEAMRFYKEIYRIERDAKNRSLTPEQRYTLRQEKIKPLLEKFKVWLGSIQPTVMPKSPLACAINYVLSRWDGMIRFINDGRLEADNNLTEQKIKPIVIARKNFMFASSVAGAKALCTHFTLQQTAKIHNLDPYHYYCVLLKNIPYCKTVEDYEKLLPWNIRSHFPELTHYPKPS